MTILPTGNLVAWPATPLSIGTIRTYGLGTLLYGLLIICQNPHRWSGPSYATVTSVAPPWMWGTLIGTFGVVVLVGSFGAWFRFRNVGLYGCALWFLLFGIAVENVAFLDPRVSYTSGVLYLMIAAAICWVARSREVRPDARFPKS